MTAAIWAASTPALRLRATSWLSLLRCACRLSARVMRARRSRSSSRKSPNRVAGSRPRARSFSSTSSRLARTKFKSSISLYFRAFSLLKPHPSILPAHVSIGWGGLLNALHDLGQVHGVVAQTRDRVGLVGIAVPAMLGPVAVFHFALVRHPVARGAGFIEKVLHQVNGVVEEVGIGRADVKMELPLELRPKLVPVALEDGIQIIVIVPVGGCLVVDGPGLLIENLRRVAVRAHRAVNRL